MDEYFIIYETTNLINGKKYRGIHKTINLNDGYLGSGFAIKNAIIKYGKKNFNREILEFCNNYDELIEKEKMYVDQEWVKSFENYNLKTGGQSSGIMGIQSRKKSSDTLKRKYKNGEIIPHRSNLGKSPSDDIKKKISNTLKEKYKTESHPSIGKTKSSASWKPGNEPWNKGIEMGPMSDEDKKKRSDTLKEKYKKERDENIIHFNCGKVTSGAWKIGNEPWNKGVVMEKIECPHCKKLFDKWNGKRWHFDNCKMKKED